MFNWFFRPKQERIVVKISGEGDLYFLNEAVINIMPHCEVRATGFFTKRFVRDQQSGCQVRLWALLMPNLTAAVNFGVSCFFRHYEVRDNHMFINRCRFGATLIKHSKGMLISSSSISVFGDSQTRLSV